MSDQIEISFGEDPMERAARLTREMSAENDRLRDEFAAHIESRTARRVHLPIYGERDIDRALRQAYAHHGYGDFITESDTDLAWEIDGYEQLWGMSLHDVDRLLHELGKRIAPEPGDDEEWDEESDEHHERMDLSFHEYDHSLIKDRWLALFVKQALRRDVREHDLAHMVAGNVRCGGEFDHAPASLEPPTTGGVYAVSGLPGWVKIGRAKNIASRMRDLQIGQPVPLRLLAVLSDNQDDEGKLHRQFAHLRGSGEWFRIDEELRAFIGSRRPRAGGAL